MNCKRGALISALITGLTAGILIYRLGAVMSPDFQSYVNGQSCWSSVATCASGRIAGGNGVRFLSMLAAIWIGWLCASPIAVLLLLASPIGAGITNAGADGIGATAIVARGNGGRKIAYKVGSVLVVAACHLVAGLCCIFAMAFQRIGLRPWVGATIAGVIAIAAQFAIARVTGITYSGIQWRYLLPGIVLAISKSAPNDTG